MGRLFVVLTLVTVAAACGSAQSATNARSSSVTTTTAPGSPPLSAAQLQRLMVAAPAPFVRAPDKSGVIEPTDPIAATAARWVATDALLAKAHFQRGWATTYRAQDGAVVDITLLSFRCAAGPTMIHNAVASHPLAGAARFLIPGAGGSLAQIGTTRHGRASIHGVLMSGRYLVVLVVRGPRGTHDYRGLVDQVAHRELARLI